MTDLLPKVPASPKEGLLSRLRQSLSLLIIAAVLVPMLLTVSILVPGPLAQETNVVIPHGISSAAIGAQLAQANAIYLSPLFRLAARAVAGGSLKAGEYAIPAHASMLDIISMMHNGQSVVRLFTVAEGLTSAEIVTLLQNDVVLTGTIDAVPADGSLLPETYRYSYGDMRASLIARMQKQMQEKLAEIWAARDQALPLTSPQQALVLASIVEKETGKVEERPRIAGVFYNRLHLNMRLQSDPTVIYALSKGRGELGRALTHDDLSFASPYNTYEIDGLPPQPICNPGRAALEAVTHPEHNNFLYFVADGTGGHAFAANLAAHNENINRWHDVLDNKK